jgi:hypothetical protein
MELAGAGVATGRAFKKSKNVSFSRNLLHQVCCYKGTFHNLVIKNGHSLFSESSKIVVGQSDMYMLCDDNDRPTINR